MPNPSSRPTPVAGVENISVCIDQPISAVIAPVKAVASKHRIARNSNAHRVRKSSPLPVLE